MQIAFVDQRKENIIMQIHHKNSGAKTRVN